jgi:hypothetical protein
MRFLANLDPQSETHRVRELLRRKGIPTITAPGGGFPLRPRQDALFVCLDEHYDDALRLLSDNAHEVANPVDVEQYELSAARQGHGSLLKLTLAVAGVVILVFAIVVYLFGYRWAQ